MNGNFQWRYGICGFQGCESFDCDILDDDDDDDDVLGFGAV
jgi:hypothetical protein